jgi:hypothetical protein
VILEGEPNVLDSIQVFSGWNIIGSLASAVSIGSIGEVPPGLVSSPYYGYNGAYATTDSIYPLRGYWVKATGNGKLVLSASSAAPMTHPRVQAESMPAAATLVFHDDQGHTQTLSVTLSREGVQAGPPTVSELPPLPPQGSFDVRFASQRASEVIQGSEGAVTMLPIDLHAPSGSLGLSWNVAASAGIRLELTYGATTVGLAGTGSVRLPQGTTQLTLKGTVSGGAQLPTAYALRQNYPNPFNPSTEIRYELPVRSTVRMMVYNLLGVPVTTLVDGEQEAGFHAVSWYPQVSSGMYFYKMEAVSSADPTNTFQQISRMLFLK